MNCPGDCTHREEWPEQASSLWGSADNCVMGKNMAQMKLILREMKM